MVTIDIVYEGSLHCRLTHGPSGVELATDAPKDNMGKGESFSPTDLVAAALGSCFMTIMGIYASKHGIDLTGTKIRVTKEMIQEPVRRIGKLSAIVNMPAGLTQNQRTALEHAALNCPVHKSLHPDVQTPVTFQYPD